MSTSRIAGSDPPPVDESERDDIEVTAPATTSPAATPPATTPLAAAPPVPDRDAPPPLADPAPVDWRVPLAVVIVGMFMSVLDMSIV
ncbi:MAG TPA: hypothetical protein VIQ30_16820, partial [Pseudonocardia sp.]